MDATAFVKPTVADCPYAVIGTSAVDTTQIVMLLLAVIGLTIVMLSTRRRIRKSQHRPRTSVRELAAESQAQRKTTRDVEEVMLELDQLSRQIHGRIDTKLARLEAIIHDADQRIDKLSRLTRAVEGQPTLEITLGEEDPLKPSSNTPKADDGPHATIYRLADRGLSPNQIAREVGKLNGEIELILALRKTKQEASQPPGSESTLDDNDVASRQHGAYDAREVH
ncbi:MAG: hypothetical protein WBE26_09445 [Phycisphaerae bacterium]